MSFRQVFSGKKFVCCALTVLYSTYNMVGQSIASIYDLGGIFNYVCVLIAVRTCVHIAVCACVHIAVCACVHIAVHACVQLAVASCSSPCSCKSITQHIGSKSPQKDIIQAH